MFPTRPETPQADDLFPLHSSLSIEEFNNVKWEDINDSNNNFVEQKSGVKTKSASFALRSEIDIYIIDPLVIFLTHSNS